MISEVYKTVQPTFSFFQTVTVPLHLQGHETTSATCPPPPNQLTTTPLLPPPYDTHLGVKDR